MFLLKSTAYGEEGTRVVAGKDESRNVLMNCSFSGLISEDLMDNETSSSDGACSPVLGTPVFGRTTSQEDPRRR